MKGDVIPKIATVVQVGSPNIFRFDINIYTYLKFTKESLERPEYG